MPKSDTRRKRQPAPHAGPPPRAAIHVLSDSTGNLARHMLTALLTQFPTDAVVPRFETFLTTEARLAAALDQAKRAGAAVCHAMVSEAFKQQIEAYCSAAGLRCLDLTGHVVTFLADATGLQPRGDLRSLHRVDEAYRRRIGAIEFTLEHDDGLGVDTLSAADVVLAGVSRTGKTPTSIYLAQQGYRVANVALAVEVPPPPQLLALTGKKVVGLVIDAQQLVMIRKRRESDWRAGASSYGEPDHVERELAWARRLFARQGWPVLDVTDCAIEETAARVLSLLGTAPPSPHPSAADTAR